MPPWPVNFDRIINTRWCKLLWNTWKTLNYYYGVSLTSRTCNRIKWPSNYKLIKTFFFVIFNKDELQAAKQIKNWYKLKEKRNSKFKFSFGFKQVCVGGGEAKPNLDKSLAISCTSVPPSLPPTAIGILRGLQGHTRARNDNDYIDRGKKDLEAKCFCDRPGRFSAHRLTNCVCVIFPTHCIAVTSEKNVRNGDVIVFPNSAEENKVSS